MAEVVVADTGIGFTADERAHLFNRFYRADVSEVQARHGSGLGLAIVEAIVEAYGGDVEASSCGAGLGSRFRARLPLFRPDTR